MMNAEQVRDDRLRVVSRSPCAYFLRCGGNAAGQLRRKNQKGNLKSLAFIIYTPET